MPQKIIKESLEIKASESLHLKLIQFSYKISHGRLKSKKKRK